VPSTAIPFRLIARDRRLKALRFRGKTLPLERDRMVEVPLQPLERLGTHRRRFDGELHAEVRLNQLDAHRLGRHVVFRLGLSQRRGGGLLRGRDSSSGIDRESDAGDRSEALVGGRRVERPELE